MLEFRTQPLDRSAVLDELSFYCEILAKNAVDATIVMFGWDSDLDIDDMWQEMHVARTCQEFCVSGPHS